MRVLITGINGFVGTHLKEFLQKKSYDVYGIDRHLEQSNILKADVRDKKRMLYVVKNVKPDMIFHLAGQSSVKKSMVLPKLTEDTNVSGTKNLLDACVDAELNPKILVASSSEVYGIQKKFPINEEARLNPINFYAESRIRQEKLSMDYFRDYNMNIVITRAFTHTGPGQKPSFVCPNLAKQIAEIEKKHRKPIVKVGNIKIRRDFTDVRDVVKAYNLTLEKCDFGQIYNICSGKSYSIKEVLDTLLCMSKIKIKVEIEKNRMRKSDVPIMIGDNSKFCNKTGWKPVILFSSTLKDILEFWRTTCTKIYK